MRRAWGMRTSQRAYEIERVRYADCQFGVPLTSVKEIIVELSKLMNVRTPYLKFRRMSRTTGNYRPFRNLITISSHDPTIRFGTIVHEFAHHVNYALDGKQGHDVYFMKTLDKCYTVAKERYYNLIVRGADNAKQVVQSRVKRETVLADSRSKFHIGQDVYFATRAGRCIKGTVHGINRRTITIKNCSDGSMGYRVSPNLVKIMEDR